MAALRALIFVTFATVSAAAGAQYTEIYRCVDAAGRSEYTNDKKAFGERKCTLVSREVNVVPAQQAPKPAPAPKPAAASPGNFPKESPAEKSSRTATKREILEKELATEQALLDKARKELSEQEGVRSGDERNYQRVLDRLQPFKDTV